MHCWMSARSSISGGSGAPAVPGEPGGVAGPITAGAGRGPHAPYPTASWTSGEGPAFTAGARRRGRAHHHVLERGEARERPAEEGQGRRAPHGEQGGRSGDARGPESFFAHAPFRQPPVDEDLDTTPRRSS